MTATDDNTQQRKFLSLKWKALMLTSMILLGIAGILSLLSYLSLQKQYETQRSAVYQQYVAQVSGLIETSEQRLHQLGAMLPNLAGVQEPLLNADSERLQGVFNEHWPRLQIDVGVELIRIYSNSNRLLGSWSGADAPEDLSSSVLGRVWYVNKHEAPVAFIDCSSNCIQYAVVPMLAEGRGVGVALIGRSLVDVILGFKQVAGTDIGVTIMGVGAKDTTGGAKDRWIRSWNANIVALTSPDHALPIIRQIASQDALVSSPRTGMRSQLHGSDYEVRLIPLQAYIASGEAGLIVVTDITSHLAEINHATRQSMLIAVVGFLIAEALLLILLWAPMSRLRSTALNLPLLSQSKYADIRSRITIPKRLHSLDDETDVLDRTAVALSHQLENLEQETKDYARTLAKRAEELTRQKDFVSSLLETAQAIIVTQNSRGEITMINHYGNSLLGYLDGELESQTFAKLIAQDCLDTNVYHDLSDLATGRIGHLHHELSVVCKDGETRAIAWYHSRPPQRGDGDHEVLSVGIDITDRKNAEERLSWLANHDPLTGLINRRRFHAELATAIDDARRLNMVGALLFLDVDQFKDVNDSSGHAAGDSLLRDVSNTLSEIMREDDFVARVGGDEFAIVIPDTDNEGAIEVAQRVKERLQEIKHILNGRIHRVSSSIGIAMFPRDGASASDVLANADMAMYQAKESSRGCWHMFSDNEQVKERLKKRVFWKARIEQALAEDHFVLFYQPIVNVKTGVASHYETLIRLQNEDGSIMGPAEFIEVAEATGIIHQIDRMVVKKAIAQLAELDAAGFDTSFSINLSAHAFSDPDIFRLIAKCVQAIDFDPARLIFEVTETAAVADFDVARESMHAIKELGCKFALDDFGVGFSSFDTLKQLPVDFVKIDGSFICKLHENTEDQMLVQALTQVAHGFEKQTVAEFVENEEIMKLLREYNVDYAQGYHLGKPLPPAQAFADLEPVAESVPTAGTAGKLTIIAGPGVDH